MNKKLFLPARALLLLTGCANKFFPDKKLYQYPEKPNDMAVVYPDGSIHHSDGSISRSDKRTGPVIETPPGEETTEAPKPASAERPAVKDSTGRHARYREK